MATLATPGAQAVSSVGQVEEPEKIISVRRLMWLRFKHNRLAMVGGLFLIVMYLSAIFAGFLAPYDPQLQQSSFISTAPYGPTWIDVNGNWHLFPFAYELSSSVDPDTFAKIYKVVPDVQYPVRLFTHGDPYILFGFIKTDIHLFGVDAPAKVFLLGTDTLGRDLFSRILYGAQVSLSVGLVGVVLTLIFGSVIGIATGYFGGLIDSIVQRIIEVLLAFPALPLWLALAMLIPPTWPSDRVYFAISIVLSLLNWGALARQTRSMVYALREADYVIAARYTNCSNWRIITRHLLPNTMSHIIVIATTAIPAMILGETALSFLGLGIRPPLISWGLLLSDAQHIRVLLDQPWILSPAIFVIATIISFNFLGDGIRDAADPFGK